MLYFGIQYGNAVKVASTDVVCPFALSVKANGHPNYADIAKEEIVNGVNVVFTFSEPILPTELNTGRGIVATTNYDPNNLYGDIAVNYNGYKSSNIHHTLTWNAAMTQLTVSIPPEALQPASTYSVKILDNRNLLDLNGNALTNSVGSWSNDIPSEYTCADFTRNFIGINFTTYGARPAAAVTDLTAWQYFNRAEDEFDYNDNAFIDWTAVDGAKSYNVYCRMIQWNTTTSVPCGSDEYAGQYHPFWMIGNTTLTGYELNFQGPGHDFPDGNNSWYEYVESLNIKLSYECYVRGVDADHIEGAESNHVVIEDTDPPQILSLRVKSTSNNWVSLPASNPNGMIIRGIRVCFNEPMIEYTVEHATWTINSAVFATGTGLSVPTVNTYVYDPVSFCLYLTFNDDATSQLISGVATTNTATCGDPVDVNILTESGDLLDIAKNVLLDPPAEGGITIPFLPYVLHTTYQCP